MQLAKSSKNLECDETPCHFFLIAACLSGNVYTRLIESHDAEKTKHISPQESSSTSEKPKPNCVVKWC